MEREITAADLIAASTAPAQIAEARKLAREETEAGTVLVYNHQ